uniref:Glutathione-dependent formaldehyde-activating protein n=1 Tax=Mycena chlorophos TaxID=658473 RepID=A0ABQ0LXJ6_MYCCL|nr:glutathione-dependent formaldehyde-activating protein [Mycena chlorophos]
MATVRISALGKPFPSGPAPSVSGSSQGVTPPPLTGTTSTTHHTTGPARRFVPVQFLRMTDLTRLPEPFFGDYARSYLPTNGSTAANTAPRTDREMVILAGRIQIAAKGRQRTQGLPGDGQGIPVLPEHKVRWAVPLGTEGDDRDSEQEREERVLEIRYKHPSEYLRPAEGGETAFAIADILQDPEDEYSCEEDDYDSYGEPIPANQSVLLPRPINFTVSQDPHELSAMMASLREETERTKKAVADAEAAMKDAMFMYTSTRAEIQGESEKWEDFWDQVGRVSGRDVVERLREKIGERVAGRVPEDEQAMLVDEIRDDENLPEGFHWTSKPRPQPQPQATVPPPPPQLIVLAPAPPSRLRKRRQEAENLESDVEADKSDVGEGMEVVRQLVARKRAKTPPTNAIAGPSKPRLKLRPKRRAGKTPGNLDGLRTRLRSPPLRGLPLQEHTKRHDPDRIDIAISAPPRRTMATTYHGNCHCGAFKFTFTPTEELKSAIACDCSICSRNSYRSTVAGSGFVVAKGDIDTTLATYLFGKREWAHKFCVVCGTPVLIQKTDESGLVLVNLRAVQDIDLDSLALNTDFKGSALEPFYKRKLPLRRGHLHARPGSQAHHRQRLQLQHLLAQRGAARDDPARGPDFVWRGDGGHRVPLRGQETGAHVLQDVRRVPVRAVPYPASDDAQCEDV